MKIEPAIALAVVVTLGIVTLGRGAPSQRCVAGQAQGFIAVRSEPPYLVGTIPDSFTSKSVYFTRRFNCLGRGAQIRRVGLGLYDVRFPGLRGRVALVTGISEEGVSASAHPLPDGTVRVALRGPLAGSEVASRRDIAFSLVIY